MAESRNHSSSKTHHPLLAFEGMKVLYAACLLLFVGAAASSLPIDKEGFKRGVLNAVKDGMDSHIHNDIDSYTHEQHHQVAKDLHFHLKKMSKQFVEDDSAFSSAEEKRNYCHQTFSKRKAQRKGMTYVKPPKFTKLYVLSALSVLLSFFCCASFCFSVGALCCSTPSCSC